MKRKTELGGTFSIASWILFIGLFATLLHQIISKRSIEVHNLRATTGHDLAAFINDMEFNITTISSMSCSHLRGLNNLVTGNPGFIDHRVVPLSTFANYSCKNTTNGPTIILKCNKCQLLRDTAYISWHFVDLPNDPATAVGFHFRLTAQNHGSNKHLSFVSGSLKNGSYHDNKPITYRGPTPNVLKFNFFPRIYHNSHDVKIIQPLFQEFLPGSYFSDTSQLRGSLQSSDNGLINTTLSLNFLTDFLVEVDSENIMGPVSFLAELGGLYCISIGIFFYLMVQCEYRIKKLRKEDSVMRNIRNRLKAQEHWDKLRKYVLYTWGCSSLDEGDKDVNGSCCTMVKIDSFHKEKSPSKQREQIKKEVVSFNRKVNLPTEKVITEPIPTQGVEPRVSISASDPNGRSSFSRVEQAMSEVRGDMKDGIYEDANVSQGHVSTDNDFNLPPPPLLELGTGSEMSMNDIQKNLQNLFEYNAILREKLVIAQSALHNFTKKASSSSADSLR